MSSSQERSALPPRAPVGARAPDEGSEELASVGSEAARMRELRELILGPEQEEIRHLVQLLEDGKRRTREVADVLPGAIAMRPQPDPLLAESLAPTLDQAFTASVKKNPQQLVAAISPVMGPAIRKAIADALQRMVQSLTVALEHSISPRSWAWRLEARRTGKSFAEIVLLRTLLYRVEQVFLIHRQTGLLLQHVVAGHAITQDADMVSGMLTAIQDFVRDSFGVKDTEALDNLHVGDLTVWVEQGSKVIVAAAIRGNAPQTLRLTLQETLEHMELELRPQLDAFEGETAPFQMAVPYLEGCLQQQQSRKATRRTGRPWLRRGLAAGIVVALIATTLGIASSIRDQWRFSRYREKLSGSPGIVVTAAERRGGQYNLAGLRDPLAADPAVLAREAGLDPARIQARWAPFYSTDARFVLARARQALEPPHTVSLSLKADTLQATGSAPEAWVERASRLAPLLPGVARLDIAAVTPTDASPPELAEARSKLVPPATVVLRLSDGQLIASGAAEHRWIVQARRLATALPGIREYDDAQLADLDRRELTVVRERLESRKLPIDPASVRISDDLRPALVEIASDIDQLIGLSHRSGVVCQVRVVGGSSADEAAMVGPALSQAVADAVVVRDALIAMGIQRIGLFVAGESRHTPATSPTQVAPGSERSVGFKVIVLDSPLPQLEPR